MAPLKSAREYPASEVHEHIHPELLLDCRAELDPELLVLERGAPGDGHERRLQRLAHRPDLSSINDTGGEGGQRHAHAHRMMCLM